MAFEQIEVYRMALAQKSVVKQDRQAFLDGLIWMLYDLIINWLPLMIIVKHVANKRRHADAAYTKAHQLVSYLNDL